MANKKSQGSRQEARRQNQRGASSFVGNKQQGITKKFGNAVRKKRLSLGYTQQEISKLAGMNRSFLSEVERGMTTISLERAEKLSQALGSNLIDLLSLY